MSYQVGDAIERTFPPAPHFNKGLFGVSTHASPFSRFVSLWLLIYHLILVKVMANTQNWVMQSMDSTLHNPHAVCHEITLPSISASILAFTREKMRWHSKSSLIEMRRYGMSGNGTSKVSPIWYDIQNSVKKKFKDVLML